MTFNHSTKPCAYIIVYTCTSKSAPLHFKPNWPCDPLGMRTWGHPYYWRTIEHETTLSNQQLVISFKLHPIHIIMYYYVWRCWGEEVDHMYNNNYVSWQNKRDHCHHYIYHRYIFECVYMPGITQHKLRQELNRSEWLARYIVNAAWI